MLASQQIVSVQHLINQDLVLFDGTCGLCNRTVQFILKHERTDSKWLFVQQESNYGREILNVFVQEQQEDTLYVVSNKVLYKKSKAAFHLAKSLCFPYNLMSWFSVLPLRVTDMLYDWVAKNRKRLVKDSCTIHATSKTKRIITDTSI